MSSGLLVVTVEMTARDGRPYEIRNVGDVYEERLDSEIGQLSANGT